MTLYVGIHIDGKCEDWRPAKSWLRAQKIAQKAIDTYRADCPVFSSRPRDVVCVIADSLGAALSEVTL